MLHENWKAILKKAWSIRLAAFWGMFNGALLGLAVFSDVMSPKMFLAANVIGYALIAVARVTKQPGADL